MPLARVVIIAVTVEGRSKSAVALALNSLGEVVVATDRRPPTSRCRSADDKRCDDDQDDGPGQRRLLWPLPAQPMSGSRPSWVSIPILSAVPQISAILPSATRKMPIASQTARRPVGAGR